MKKLKGFTIIELLIVMAVIAILVGIAVPSFRAIQNQAWTAKAQGDIKVIKMACESYYIQHRAFPSAATYQTLLLSETPPMLESNLYDPFGGATDMYKYALSPDAKFYVVYSVGPGGNGTATVANTGIVTTTNSPIWISNGHE